jgi:hypothetical protein
MSDLPVPMIISYENDFLIHLFAIPGEAKVGDLVAGAASLAYGVHLPECPLSSIRVRRIDESAPLPLDLTVNGVGIEPMEWLHIFVDADAEGEGPK